MLNCIQRSEDTLDNRVYLVRNMRMLNIFIFPSLSKSYSVGGFPPFRSGAKLDEDGVFVEKGALPLVCLHDAQVAVCRGHRELLGRLRPSSAPTMLIKPMPMSAQVPSTSPPVSELLECNSWSLFVTTDYILATNYSAVMSEKQ